MRLVWLCVLLATIINKSVLVAAEEITSFSYHSNDQLYETLRRTNDEFQQISHLYSIGTSAMGEELWVLMLSMAGEHDSGIPNVKIVGNIHGNEPVGRELTLHFVQTLVNGYRQNDSDIVDILKSTKLHFLPTVNPDGFTKAIEGECTVGPGRKNANNVDLDRDFVPVFAVSDTELLRSRERETSAIIEWMSEIKFVLSLSIHSGSSVVVYPYDESSSSGDVDVESPTDDNDVFRHLAEVYAGNSRGAIGEQCPQHRRQFDGGITNGAAWFPARGTMADYNYYYHGCMELTLEVSCCKYPHPSQLGDIFHNHSPALTALLREVHQGVAGVVTCEGMRGVSYIQVLGRNVTLQTGDDGEYWRLLLPGRYFLQVESGSCRTEIVAVDVPRRPLGEHPRPVVVNINLKKLWIQLSDEDEVELMTIRLEEETEIVNSTARSSDTTHSSAMAPPNFGSSISSAVTLSATVLSHMAVLIGYLLITAL